MVNLNGLKVGKTTNVRDKKLPLSIKPTNKIKLFAISAISLISSNVSTSENYLHEDQQKLGNTISILASNYQSEAQSTTTTLSKFDSNMQSKFEISLDWIRELANNSFTNLEELEDRIKFSTLEDLTRPLHERVDKKIDSLFKPIDTLNTENTEVASGLQAPVADEYLIKQIYQQEEENLLDDSDISIRLLRTAHAATLMLGNQELENYVIDIANNLVKELRNAREMRQVLNENSQDSSFLSDYQEKFLITEAQILGIADSIGVQLTDEEINLHGQQIIKAKEIYSDPNHENRDMNSDPYFDLLLDNRVDKFYKNEF